MTAWPIPAEPATNYGLTYTPMDGGMLRVEGTSDRQTVTLMGYVDLPAGEWTVALDGGTGGTGRLWANVRAGSTTLATTRGTGRFTLTAPTRVGCYIGANQGTYDTTIHPTLAPAG